MSITVFQEHRKEHWRVHVRKVCGDEELERSVRSVEVMAFVAEFSPVAVCERDLHLREEYLFERRAKILWHIRRVRKLIQATVSIRLCSTDALCCTPPGCLKAVA